MQKSNKIHIYVVLLPKGLMLDTVGPVEVFNYANRLGGERFEVQFVGAEQNIINSVGMSLKVDPLPTQVRSPAWVLVPGMLGDSIELDTPAVEQTCTWLQQHCFAQIISVCGGALILAKAGLLATKKCTTHYMHIEQLRNLLDKQQVLENRLFVQDENVFTSAGVSAGIDLALYLVEQEYNALVCVQIARRMVLFTRRGSQDPAQSPYLQHRNHLNEKVLQAQDLMQSQPQKNWGLAELASHVFCSERHLARLFKQHIGLTSKEYLYQLRLALAKQLLHSSKLKISHIAQQCGFEDVRHFRRLWARYYNKPPSHYRH